MEKIRFPNRLVARTRSRPPAEFIAKHLAGAGNIPVKVWRLAHTHHAVSLCVDVSSAELKALRQIAKGLRALWKNRTRLAEKVPT